jgi:hypothetical protein
LSMPAARDVACAPQLAKDSGCTPFVTDINRIGAGVNLGGLVEDRPPNAFIDDMAVFQVEGNEGAGKSNQTDKDRGKRDADIPTPPQGTEQHKGAPPKARKCTLDLLFGLKSNWHFRNVMSSPLSRNEAESNRQHEE